MAGPEKVNPKVNPEVHLFICTNDKASAECCAKKGGIELRDKLKLLSKEKQKGWQTRVRINASGCLGRCSEGVAAVLYPQGTWFTELTAESSKLLEKAVDDALLK